MYSTKIGNGLKKMRDKAYDVLFNKVFPSDKTKLNKALKTIDRMVITRVETQEQLVEVTEKLLILEARILLSGSKSDFFMFEETTYLESILAEIKLEANKLSDNQVKLRADKLTEVEITDALTVLNLLDRVSQYKSFTDNINFVANSSINPKADRGPKSFAPQKSFKTKRNYSN